MPLLTPAQDEALNMLAQVAEEGCVTLPFEVGDLQLVNNHNCFHGRTSYVDDPAAVGGTRELLRLWLQLDEPRDLPDGAFALRARGVRADSAAAVEHFDVCVGPRL